jgi:hypothetical protein
MSSPWRLDAYYFLTLHWKMLWQGSWKIRPPPQMQISMFEHTRIWLVGTLHQCLYNNWHGIFQSIICKIVTLNYVLYGCKTWSFTLMEEHRLKVFENRVPRSISATMGEEVIWGWIKVHNVELHHLFSSPDTIRMIKSRRMRLVEHVEK